MGGTTNDNVKDVCADPRGTGVVAVGGFSQTAQFGSTTTLTSTGYYDAFAVRLSNTGAFQWASKAGGFGQEQANCVRLDGQGSVYLGMDFTANLSSVFGGPALANVGGKDGLLVKLAATTGLAVSGGVIPIAGLGDESVQGVDTLGAGTFVGAGSMGSGAGFPGFGNASTYGADGFLAKFLVSSVAREAVAEESTPQATGAGLIAYPNPTSGDCAIRLDVAGEGTHTLTLLDAKGFVVWTGYAGSAQLRQGYNLNLRLAPGLYMMRAGGKVCRIVVQ